MCLHTMMQLEIIGALGRVASFPGTLRLRDVAMMPPGPA